MLALYRNCVVRSASQGAMARQWSDRIQLIRAMPHHSGELGRHELPGTNFEDATSD